MTRSKCRQAQREVGGTAPLGQITQVCQENNRLLVRLRLCHRDELLYFCPELLFAPGQSIQAPLSVFSRFARLLRLFFGGFSSFFTPTFFCLVLGGPEQFTDRPSVFLGSRLVGFRGLVLLHLPPELIGDVHVPALHHTQKHLILCRRRKGRNPGTHLVGMILLIPEIRTRLGRDREQVQIEAQEISEGFQGGRKPLKVGRYRRLDLVVVQLSELSAHQPAKIKRAQITAA